MSDNRVPVHHYRIAQSWAPYDVFSIWAVNHDHAIRKMKRLHDCYGLVLTVDGKPAYRP